MLKRVSNDSSANRVQPRRSLGPIRLSLSWRLTIYVIALGLWVSGAAWLVLHYFMMQRGQFGTMPHPAEYWTIATHAAFGFLVLFVFGAMLERHMKRAWPTHRRRASGLAFVTLLSVLIVSGYLLYYAGEEQVRAITALAHWGLGLASPILFFLHRFARH